MPSRCAARSARPSAVRRRSTSVPAPSRRCRTSAARSARFALSAIPTLEPESAYDVQRRRDRARGRVQRLGRLLGFDFENPIVAEPLAPLVDFVFPDNSPTCSAGESARESLHVHRRKRTACDCARQHHARRRQTHQRARREDVGHRCEHAVELGHARRHDRDRLNGTYVLKYDVDAAIIDGPAGRARRSMRPAS